MRSASLKDKEARHDYLMTGTAVLRRNNKPATRVMRARRPPAHGDAPKCFVGRQMTRAPPPTSLKKLICIVFDSDC